MITYRNVADNSTRSITLDGGGRVVKSVDERGVRTETAFNASGQPLQVTAAVGTSDQRIVRYYYNAQMDLAAFDPPSGSAARVSFEYWRYDRPFFGSGAPTKAFPDTYVGQVTRILFPDGTSEYFGFNGAEEPEWTYRPGSGYTTLVRDSLHRVWKVDYPATPFYPAFST